MLKQVVLVFALFAAALATTIGCGIAVIPERAWVDGTVIDAVTREPVANAEVVVLRGEGEWRARTDERGRFHVAGVPVGAINVTARATGYGTRTLEGRLAAPGTAFDFLLTPQR